MNVEQILQHRKEIDENRFYISLKVLEECLDVAIVARKDRVGLKKEDLLLLQPIFDRIVLLDDSYAVVFIEGLCGLYCITDEKWILPFAYQDIQQIADTKWLELIAVTGKGIYDLSSQSVLLPAEYDDFSSFDQGEYFWAIKNNSYVFVKNQTGEIFCISDVCFAYDTMFGIFAKNKDGDVMCYDEKGYSQYMTLRRFVIENKGRGVLYNYKFNTKSIIDIYGKILNI